MSDGGESLFRFVEKAHALINVGRIAIKKWIEAVQIIFKQMVDAIEWIHSKNICHFDISLENVLINDVDVRLTNDDKMEFITKSIQIKLCDFGYVTITYSCSH